METPARTTHTRTVIFLHGRDSTASEFMPEFFESQASDDRTIPEILPKVKWVFPAADLVKSTRFGTDLSQWFDMHSTEDPHEQEENQDLKASMNRLEGIIAAEVAIVGPNNVFLGGISQSCALAIRTLLDMRHIKLAGLIGLCSWMPQISQTDNVPCPAKETPVLLCHSQDDEVINIKYGLELRDTLRAAGMAVESHIYPDGGHWVNEPLGVDDLVAFVLAH